MRGRLKLFSTRALAGYTRQVTNALRAYPQFKESSEEQIHGELSISRFADGEMEAEVGTSVRGLGRERFRRRQFR